MIPESLLAARCSTVADSLEQPAAPLVARLLSQGAEQPALRLLCCERTPREWLRLLPRAVRCYTPQTLSDLERIATASTVLVDSFGQLCVSVGAQHCFRFLRELLLNPMITKLIIILHVDCFQRSSKLQSRLEDMSQLIVFTSRASVDSGLRLTMSHKKGGKLVNITEDIWYDETGARLCCAPIYKQVQKREEPEDVLPHKLTTFKIGLESNEQKAKNELELPYLIKKETGKVYYEHDEADDWDDEDPDEDLDI